VLRDGLAAWAVNILLALRDKINVWRKSGGLAHFALTALL